MMWDDSTTPKKIELQIIPMIDIMMFLMVFFVLLSINVIPSKGMKTALPTSSQAEDIKRSKILITITADGVIQVNQDVVSEEVLTQTLIEQQRSSKEVYVVIKGDQKTSLQRLMTVMDAAKAAGIEDIGIAERPK